MGGGGGGGGQGFNNVVVNELVQIKVEDFLKGNFTPALFVRPMRAIVVSASFPWKKQLEEFKNQLRYNSLAELMANASDQPKFKGFKVKRRVTTPDGQAGKWEDFDWLAKYYPMYREKIMEDHQDPPELLPVIPSEDTEMLVPLPKLVRGDYPAITMASIQRTLNTIRNGKDGNRIPPGSGKLAGEGNMFARGGAGGVKKPPTEQPKDSTPANDAQEAFLIRFIDVDVLPGHAYEYQVRVRASNPNFGKKSLVSRPDHATAEELDSDPVIATFSDGPRVTTQVRSPDERYVFASTPDPKEAPKADHVRVQIHNWTEAVRIDRSRVNSFEPVADWIVEDVAIPRGQFVIGTKNVKVPIWSPTKTAFQFMELGKSSKPNAKGSLPLDLAAPAMLVDFDGGQIRQNVTRTRSVTDEAGVEVLFLGEGGKLHARAAWADIADADRAARETGWTTWQKNTKEAGAPAKPGEKNPFDK